MGGAASSPPASGISSDPGHQLPRASVPVTSGSAGDQITYREVSRYTVEMVDNADRLWSPWFIGEGYPAPFVQLETIEPNTTLTLEGCTDGSGAEPTPDAMPSDFPNAFYCPAPNGHLSDRGFIVIPIESLAGLWSGNIYGKSETSAEHTGDFAAGAVLAHEFGHHVVDELLLDTNSPEPQGKNSELIADCFSGIHAYALSLGVDGYLDPGDIEEALAALELMGDPPEGSNNPHGTAAERGNAYRIGLAGTTDDPRGGVPDSCIQVYWPQFAR